MNIQDAVKRIVELRQSRQLTLLVGAGLSMDPPTSFPSWSTLIDKMAEVVRPYRSVYADAMLDERSRGDLVAAGDFFDRLDVVPRSVRAEFFAKTFAKRNRNVPNSYELVAIFPSHIHATTNFDSNLTDAFGAADVLDNDDASLRSFLDHAASTPQRIYLHGRAHKFDTLVYSRATFDALLKRDLYRDVLKGIFTQTLRSSRWLLSFRSRYSLDLRSRWHTPRRCRELTAFPSYRQGTDRP